MNSKRQSVNWEKNRLEKKENLPRRYSNVSWLITSMIGQTIRSWFSEICLSRVSSQPIVTSQCASKNVSVLPVEIFAPCNRARIKPLRFDIRSIRTGLFSEFT